MLTYGEKLDVLQHCEKYPLASDSDLARFFSRIWKRKVTACLIKSVLNLKPFIENIDIKFSQHLQHENPEKQPEHHIRVEEESDKDTDDEQEDGVESLQHKDQDFEDEARTENIKEQEGGCSSRYNPRLDELWDISPDVNKIIQLTKVLRFFETREKTLLTQIEIRERKEAEEVQKEQLSLER